MEENQALPDRRPPTPYHIWDGGGKVGRNQTEAARKPARRRVCRVGRQVVSFHRRSAAAIHLHANAACVAARFDVENDGRRLRPPDPPIVG